MKFGKALAVAPLAALALAGSVAGTTRTAAADDPPTPSVSVHLDDGANGPAVAGAITDIEEDNRGEFVRQAVDAAHREAGGQYDVVLMNLSQGYEERLEGKRLYANVRWGAINYGLWIAESGQFTNTGDGGYINWGFKGVFDRDGNTITFH